MPRAREAAPRVVVCYHCKKRLEVGAKAITLPCPFCHQTLTIGDVIVNTLKAVRKLQTCGRVVVERRGRVTADLVEAQGGVDVDGVMEANVVSGGPVRIGAKAQWKGDCRAPSLLAELGCTIARGYFVIPDDSVLPQSGGARPAAQEPPEPLDGETPPAPKPAAAARKPTLPAAGRSTARSAARREAPRKGREK